jgi:hypothetical protein
MIPNLRIIEHRSRLKLGFIYCRMMGPLCLGRGLCRLIILVREFLLSFFLSFSRTFWYGGRTWLTPEGYLAFSYVLTTNDLLANVTQQYEAPTVVFSTITSHGYGEYRLASPASRVQTC